MGPFLVEYSEDDSGCGFGIVVIGTMLAVGLLLVRVAVAARAARR